MLSQYDYDVDESMEDFLVSLFIDCTIMHLCRTGGGPMAPGVHAPRYSYLVQEAMYNGWKKCHGIKKQSIGLSNGMAFHVSKGYSCRRHDLHLLVDILLHLLEDKSDINDRLVELTSEHPPAEHFSCYGDSAYPQQDRICCKRDGDEFTELNKAMNGCRESIEWMYRDLTQSGEL
jgi:DDE superfamily endonuclease